MSSPLPETFATSRLQAERLIAAHLPDLCRMDQDPGMMAWLGGVRDAAGTQAYLERNLAHWAEYGFGLYVLRDLATAAVMGRACVRHLMLDAQDEIEIGYGFLPPFWGRGLATEIAHACVSLGLEELGWPSVVGLTLRENRGSQRVLVKAGLSYEREATHAGQQHMLYRGRRTSSTG